MDDPNSNFKPDESFRDSIATINEQGKRAWIYALQPKGKLYNLRSYASLIYLLVLFSLPFIKIDGEPLFLFNVLERRFNIFGYVFWPQDFYLFGLGMITFIIFIALFTVAFGRIFCGWACPQTIFMELVFRKIEYWIEGDSSKQKQLDKAPWNQEKIIKKGSKWIVFYLVSFIIANTLLAYVIGVDDLFRIMSEPISKHTGGFIGIFIFTSIFFFIYLWFREQVCLVVCPYGRMQGVLLDKDSIVVAYDYVRGEPRGHIKKNEERAHGDCVDCNLCVKVCPTGIDIRHGTQLECVNCTACIDACDTVMDKVGYDRGLIRYASENGIANKKKLTFTPRLKAYSIVLTILIGVLGFLLYIRSDVDATITRTPGQLYQSQPNNQISNLYNIKLVNKTRKDMPVTLKVEGVEAEVRMVGKPNIVVKSSSLTEGEFFIILDEKYITQRKNKLNLSVYSNGKLIKKLKTNFLGPMGNRNKK
ncbi:MAG: cytochrome c oxidase accessory protein CcoG [Bacteroidota bacterium]